MALYAAYGSNLDPEQMLTRAPHSPAQGTGWLQGWRLTFGGEELSFEGALATVVEDSDSQVFVMLYDVPSFDEPELDRWEGNALGLYDKIRVRVATLDGDLTAWLYVLNGYEGGLPSARYLGMVADCGGDGRSTGRLRERVAAAAVQIGGRHFSGRRPGGRRVSTLTTVEAAAQAAAVLAELTGVERHDVAIVLGSGWVPAAEAIGTPTHDIAVTDLPGFAPPAVLGHAGRIRSIDAGWSTGSGVSRSHPPLRGPRRRRGRARRADSGAGRLQGHRVDEWMRRASRRLRPRASQY